MMPLVKLAPPIMLISLAGACAGDHELGSTVQHNIAVQIADRDPHYIGDPIEGGSGKRGTAAVNRYLGGDVKDLLKVDSKSQVGTQGGAGNSATGPDHGPN